MLASFPSIGVSKFSTRKKKTRRHSTPRTPSSMGKRAPKKGGMRWGGATFAVTLGESAPAGFTTKAHGTGAAGLMSSSMRKKAVGVKLAGRLGQKLEVRLARAATT